MSYLATPDGAPWLFFGYTKTGNRWMSYGGYYACVEGVGCAVGAVGAAMV